MDILSKSLDNRLMTTNWDDYDLFCHVVEHGNFSAAARALDRPKSSLSAAVIRLETALQVRLLERTTRKLRMTEAGEALFHGMGPLFSSLREAHRAAVEQRQGVSGTLRIASPYEFAAEHLAQVVCAMMSKYRQLHIELNVHHASINPLDQGYDMAFAMLESSLPASTIVVRRVVSLERKLYAAPELLQAHRFPTTPRQVAQMPMLVGLNDTEWRLKAPDGSTQRISLQLPRLVSANADVRLQAAIAGLGVMRVTNTFAAPSIRAGLLQPVLPDHSCDPLRVYALLPAKRLMSEKVRVFLDILETQVTEDLAGRSAPGWTNRRLIDVAPSGDQER
jgi:DNA-binding transcriptional LysR family regulator